MDNDDSVNDDGGGGDGGGGRDGDGGDGDGGPPLVGRNKDDFAVLRSNNWLAWLTVTSSRGERGEGAAQLIINQNQNTLKAPKNTFYNLDKHI